MVTSVLYVSRKTTPWPDDGPDVAAITEIARARNAALGVTGALISTEHHFAQILEGDAESICTLMESICRDPRHSEVTLVQQIERDVRWFANWSLAYAGYASYVGRQVAPLLEGGSAKPRRVESLVKLMRAFAARPEPAQR